MAIHVSLRFLGVERVEIILKRVAFPIVFPGTVLIHQTDPLALAASPMSENKFFKIRKSFFNIYPYIKPQRPRKLISNLKDSSPIGLEN